MARYSSRLKIILAVVITLLVTLILLSVSVKTRADREGRWYETLFLGALSPFQKGATYVHDKVGTLVHRYIYIVHVAEENDALKRNQQQLEAQLLRYRQLVEENNRLRELVAFQGSRTWHTVAARVIAHNPQAEFRLLTINRGRGSGLKKRMPVVSPDGLVGQIYRVGHSTSQVLLVTDPTSVVDARLAMTGARGLIRGRVMTTKWDRSYFLTALEYVDGASLVEKGAMAFTSGLDGVFPPGVPIGIVHKVKENSYGIFQDAEVVPLADLMSLREVLIVTDWQD